MRIDYHLQQYNKIRDQQLKQQNIKNTMLKTK